MRNLDKLSLACGILFIACVSCKKDSDNSNSSGLSGNTLSGKISNWSYGSDKKLSAYTSYSGDIIGQSTISSDGSFKLTLQTPTESEMETVGDFFDPTLAISDPAAQCADIWFEITDASDTYFGYIDRSTQATTGLAKGYAITEYLYSTKKTTVKGKLTDTETNYSEIANFDVSLAQGWNAIVMQVTKYIETTDTFEIEYNVGNSEPSSVKWIYFPDKKKKAAKLF